MTISLSNDARILLINILDNANKSIRACLHFKDGDKNEINCHQTRKIAQILSGHCPAI